MDKYCLSDLIDPMYKPENWQKLREWKAGSYIILQKWKKMDIGKKFWKDKWVPDNLQKQLELWE